MTDARFQFMVIVVSAFAALTTFAIKWFITKKSNNEKLTGLIDDVKIIKDEISTMKQDSIHYKANMNRLEGMVKSLLDHLFEFISGKKK